ncbi:uncharacterized protein LOC143039877 [Oratosquilla oratoria]|uniref:uncharacterized protein LOC143039877 n=1 Tax=Oratosquilla oratoria TaxID=337810 RepID=UPI003F7691AB
MKKITLLVMPLFLTGICSSEVASTFRSPSSSPSSSSPSKVPSSPLPFSSSSPSIFTSSSSSSFSSSYFSSYSSFSSSSSSTNTSSPIRGKKIGKGENEEGLEEKKKERDKGILEHHDQYTEETWASGRSALERERGASEGSRELRQGTEGKDREEDYSKGIPTGTGRTKYGKVELTRLRNPLLKHIKSKRKGQRRRVNTEYKKEEKGKKKEEEEKEEEKEGDVLRHEPEIYFRLQGQEDPQSLTSWTQSAAGTILQATTSLPLSGSHSPPSVGLQAPLSSSSKNLLRVNTSSLNSSKRSYMLTTRESRVLLAKLRPPLLVPHLPGTENRENMTESGMSSEPKSFPRYVGELPKIKFQKEQQTNLGTKKSTKSQSLAQFHTGSSQISLSVRIESTSSVALHKSSSSTFQEPSGKALPSPTPVAHGPPTLAMASPTVSSVMAVTTDGAAFSSVSVSTTAPVLSVSATLPFSVTSLLRSVSPPPIEVFTMHSSLALPRAKQIRDKDSKSGRTEKNHVIFTERLKRAAKTNTNIKFNVTANPLSSALPSPAPDSSSQETNTRKKIKSSKSERILASSAPRALNTMNSLNKSDMTSSILLEELKTTTPTLPVSPPTPAFQFSTPDKTSSGGKRNSLLDVFKYATAQSNYSRHSVKYVTMDEFRKINLSEILKSPQLPTQSPTSDDPPGRSTPTNVLKVSEGDEGTGSTPMPFSTVPSTWSIPSPVTSQAYRRPRTYPLKKNSALPRHPVYPLPLPPLIVVLPPTCNLSQSSCFNLTLNMVHQVHEVAEKINSYHNQTVYNFDLDGYGSFGSGFGSSGGVGEESWRNGTGEDGNGPARRNDEQAFVYIIVVLAFYSSGIVFMMVKYMRKEWQEQEETKLYSQYVKAARERLITTNMRGNLANRLALQALNTANAVPQTTEGSKVTFV